MLKDLVLKSLNVHGTVRADKIVCQNSGHAGASPGPTGPTGPAGPTVRNLLGGHTGSIPYLSTTTDLTFLGIGTEDCVMTSTGSEPVWKPPARGFEMSFSGAGRAPGFLYANVGCHGLTDTSPMANVSTSCISPVYGFIDTLTVTWTGNVSGAGASILVSAGAATAEGTSDQFSNASGSCIIALDPPLSIDPNDVICVRVTKGLGHVTVGVYVE